MKRKSGFHGVGVSCRCCDKQKTSLYTYFPLLAKFILADCRVSTSLTAAAVDMNVEQCNSALGCLVLAVVVPQKTKEWESESRRDFKITHSTCSPNPILFRLLFFMISRRRIKSSRPSEKNELICFLFYFYYYYDYYYKRRKWGGFDFQKWYDENNACFPLDWCMALTVYYVHFNLFFSNK